MSFQVRLGTAIDCAHTVSVNGYAIDDSSEDGQEHVLTCHNMRQFKALDQLITVDDHGCATAKGYEREDSDFQKWEEEELVFEFRVSHPLSQKDIV